MSAEIKLCKDCKWYEFDGWHDTSYCKNKCTFKEEKVIDFVAGDYVKRLKVNAWRAREFGACGVEGKYFERRPTLLERVKGWLK